ncbi:pyrimidine reductase [Asanoa ishikariensis]|uniref:RibD C-terminal domain-containing protein n=1 Tax=Asanoa ishikariensis TaxID=137265 RepID=A0A1H3TIK6_9ACTN|nr:dihydrofolate reductase family protein [Asanoa ishikariensis]GIF62435.1 pyrimidine reductase [Asanoa ishikariensis]SDZ49631.1 RibD C-terminal domain-containing protein [Asanoa ishikariensis]
MGKIIVSENVTLDGVGQDPTGEEGFDRGGWFTRISDADRAAWAEVEQAEAMAAAALLLGRHSHDWFATRWADRTGAWADRLNALPKYVVSTTLDEPRWANSTALPPTEVAKLKDTMDGDIVVYASRQLVHTLFEQDLVDEVRLMVFPFVLGAGDRVFGEAAGSMRLVEARRIGADLTFLTYRTVRF